MERTTKYSSSKPFMIIIHGPMGAGKTALADLLHDEIANTAHFGVDHIKWLVSDFKNIPSHTQVAKNMIPLMAEGYLKQNINLILEQAFTATEIETLESCAHKQGVQLHIYGLDTSREILNARIAERTQKLNKPEISIEHINNSYTDYKKSVYQGGTIFDSGKQTVREMADRVLKDLGLL